MAEKKKLSLKEKLAAERKNRTKPAQTSLAKKKSLKRAKKDLVAIEKKVEEIHKAEQLAPQKKKAPPPKEPKERFTLWLPLSVYNKFKVHVATRRGSGSDYIESLIRKDLKLK